MQVISQSEGKTAVTNPESGWLGRGMVADNVYVTNVRRQSKVNLGTCYQQLSPDAVSMRMHERCKRVGPQMSNTQTALQYLLWGEQFHNCP